MLNKEIISKLSLRRNSKSQYVWELCCSIHSDNPVITWDEYYEINNRHASFEIAFEQLGMKFI